MENIGLVSPVVFYIKFLIQHLWSLGLKWDEIPPPEVTSRWAELKSQLSEIQNLKINRHLLTDNVKYIDIHAFGDASERGYATVIYFRTVDVHNKVQLSFVISKSKVAPLKRISLPRLELCAAHLLSKLVSFILNAYSLWWAGPSWLSQDQDLWP